MEETAVFEILEYVANAITSISNIFGGVEKALGAFIAALTITGIFFKWWRSRTIKKGLYTAIWTDHDKQRVRCELVALKKSFTGISISPICRPRAKGDYGISAGYDGRKTNVLSGIWGKPNYRGSIQLTHHQNNRLLLGRWLGPDRESNIRSGDWVSKYKSSLDYKILFRLSYPRLIDNIMKPLEIILSTDSIVATLISQKKEITAEGSMFEVDGLRLRVPDGIFNPHYGSVTRKVLEASLDLMKPNMRVLDLGTGSGYYALYLAKNFNCTVVGVDSDPECVRLAGENAIRNNVQDVCTFFHCEPDELYSWAKFNTEFDIIIANLPFTSTKFTWGSRKSPYYKSFTGSRHLLNQLLVESLSFISPAGSLVISMGDKGYQRHFNDLLSYSPWGCEEVSSFTGRFDTTRVMRLTLSAFLRDVENEIVSITGNRAETVCLGWSVKK